MHLGQFARSDNGPSWEHFRHIRKSFHNAVRGFEEHQRFLPFGMTAKFFTASMGLWREKSEEGKPIGRQSRGSKRRHNGRSSGHRHYRQPLFNGFTDQSISRI